MDRFDKTMFIIDVIATIASLITACFYFASGETIKALIDVLCFVSFGADALVLYKKNIKNKKQ